MAVVASPINAAEVREHHFSWWDMPGDGVIVLPKGVPPAEKGIRLVDLDEWHLDQAQTTQWYNGLAIAGLPTNPFNPANRGGLIGGIAPVVNAEAFIYQIVNVGFGSGNGSAAGPFSFTNGVGLNDLSGINIIDRHGALNIAPPVPGSQFMSTTLLPGGFPGTVLDMTPGAIIPGGVQDWDFNAFSGPGNFGWDISPRNGPGVVAPPLGPGVFGFAMPGNWLDAVSDGWIHSWDANGQINMTPAVFGFSGPKPIPEPSAWILLLLSAGALGTYRWKGSRRP